MTQGNREPGPESIANWHEAAPESRPPGISRQFLSAMAFAEGSDFLIVLFIHEYRVAGARR